jgi:hypothetical protein
MVSAKFRLPKTADNATALRKEIRNDSLRPRDQAATWRKYSH